MGQIASHIRNIVIYIHISRVFRCVQLYYAKVRMCFDYERDPTTPLDSLGYCRPTRYLAVHLRRATVVEPDDQTLNQNFKSSARSLRLAKSPSFASAQYIITPFPPRATNHLIRRTIQNLTTSTRHVSTPFLHLFHQNGAHRRRADSATENP